MYLDAKTMVIIKESTEDSVQRLNMRGLSYLHIVED